jgi:hypothetical protein
MPASLEDTSDHLPKFSATSLEEINKNISMGSWGPFTSERERVVFFNYVLLVW